MPSNENSMENEVVSNETQDNSLQEQGSTKESELSSQAEGESNPSKDEANRVYSQDELDAITTATRKVTERRMSRKFQKELEQRTQHNQQQSTQNGNIHQNNSQPEPIWDDVNKVWIPPTMTTAEYAKWAARRAAGENIPLPSVSPSAGVQNTVPSQSNPIENYTNRQNDSDLTEEAEKQALLLSGKKSDFKEIINYLPITAEMANSAAIDPNGMANLYDLAKNSPTEVLRIIQLSPEKQRMRMYEMNIEAKRKKAPKVQSNATPQPAPLTGVGTVNKPYEKMSYMEKKAFRKRDLERRYQSA